MDKVLLINANTNLALMVARGLGSQGVPVDGVGWNGGVGMRSRYLGKKIWVDGYKALTAEKLEEVIAQTKPHFIMALGEEVLTHLNALRNTICGSVKFLFPEQRILMRAFDKEQTLQYAAQVGIDCPKTFQVDSAEGLLRVLDQIRYPVVLKFAQSIRSSLPSRLRFRYRYVFDRAELTRVLAPYDEFKEFPLIQEYAPGKGVGVELCMHKGKVVAAFQHERIHEVPLAGGTSVYRKSVALRPELLEQSVALLRRMEWEGVAMVEFRRDPATKHSVLMEVNGRFWGSLPLAVRAGTNFPFVLYQTMGQGVEVRPAPYSVNLKVKQSGPHLRWLWQALFVRTPLPPEGFISRQRALWEFLCSLDPRVKFDVEEFDDPLPGIHYWLDKLQRVARDVVSIPRAAAGAWRR